MKLIPRTTAMRTFILSDVVFPQVFPLHVSPVGTTLLTVKLGQFPSFVVGYPGNVAGDIFVVLKILVSRLASEGWISREGITYAQLAHRTRFLQRSPS